MRNHPPPVFSGGPRYTREPYQDSMAAARENGRPDLFNTFTCNHRWREIEATLSGNQAPEDRPDLTDRVFRLKVAALPQDSTRNHVPGRPAGRLYVVEFQKRGLPRAHILVIPDPADTRRSTDIYDHFDWAGLPDGDADPDLRRSATTCEMRGPRRTLNPTPYGCRIANTRKDTRKSSSRLLRKTTGTRPTDDAIADDARKNAASCPTTDGRRPTISCWPAGTPRTSTSKFVAPFRQGNAFTGTCQMARAEQ